jgi:hypothetical protein
MKRGTRVINIFQDQTEPLLWIRTTDGVESVQSYHQAKPGQYERCLTQHYDLYTILLVAIPTIFLLLLFVKFWSRIRYYRNKRRIQLE